MKLTLTKKRTGIRRVSIARAVQNSKYAMLKDIFLSRNKTCKKCGGLADDVHHSRGRSGKLLCATQFWIAMCRLCHTWVHDHPEEARKVGLLCERGKWGCL